MRDEPAAMAKRSALIHDAFARGQAALTGGDKNEAIRWLAVAGIVLTAINMFGGFAVTQRMLAMFRK